MAGDDYTIGGESTQSSELDALFEKWIASGNGAGGAAGAGFGAGARSSASAAGADWSSSATSGAGASWSGGATMEPPIPMPNGFNVIREGGGITITRKWFSPTHIFLLVFAVVWNAILLVFFGGFAASGISFGGTGLFFGLFMIPFVAAGAGVGYSAIAGFVNTTTLSVRDGVLAVKHAPLPWWGQVTLNAHELTQLYTRELRSTSSSSSGRSRTTYTYAVMAIHGPDNRETRILSGLTEPGQAQFAEWTVERFLGITDRPVRGEFRG
jgi:hypothetical protein